MKKVKVLHLITGSQVGGSQDNTFSTCELHDREQYEVHLACNPRGQWIDRARRAADVFHPIATLVTPIRPLDDFRAFITIWQLLRRERFDVVHTHTAKAGILGRIAAWLAGGPVVHTYHAFPWHTGMAKWRRAFYVCLERICRQLTDHVLTVSENERQEGVRRKVICPANSQTVYSGIDFSKMDVPVDVAALRAELKIPAGWRVVVMAGRLDPQKAPHLLVEAFRYVVHAQPQTLLLIAGDGELRPLVERRIRELGLVENVRVLGFREDVPQLLRVADVFTLSSLWEGMGRAMVEAMLVGKPVVVPAVNGIPEVVHHGTTGRLYEAGNINQLARQLIEVLADAEERQRLGTNARELTRRIFDVQLMVHRIEAVYADLAARVASPRVPSARAISAAPAPAVFPTSIAR